jgi:hypothetical protein
MRAGWIVVLLLAGCGEKDFCETTDDCNPGHACSEGVCQATCSGTDCHAVSLWPKVAAANQTVTIEGVFPDVVEVHFSGSMSAPVATMLGAHRLRVTVPADATSGAITLTSGGVPFDTISGFRFTTWSPLLGATPVQVPPSTVRQPSQLTHAHSGHCVIRSGHFVYAVGGVDETGAPLLDVERALANLDGSLGNFEPLPLLTLSTPHSGAACAATDGYLYIVGGERAPGVFSDAIDILAVTPPIVSDGGITESAPMLLTGKLGHARSDAAAIVVGDKLVVAGGRDGSGVLSSVETWILGKGGRVSLVGDDQVALNVPRAGAAIALAGDKLLLMGGSTTSGAVVTSVESSTLTDRRLEPFVIDPLQLVNGRIAPATVTIGDWLYLIGGSSGGGPWASIESVSLSRLDKFVDAGFALTYRRAGAAAVTNGNFVHLVGGTSPIGEAIGFDKGALVGKFTQNSSLPDPQAGDSCMAAIGPYLYIIGGNFVTANQASITPLTNVVRAQRTDNGELTQMSQVGPLTAARHACVAAVIGDWLYVIGGMYNSIPIAPPNIERAPIDSNGAIGAFAPTDATVQLVPGRSSMMAAIVGDHLYIIGGRENGTNVNTVVDFPITAGELGQPVNSSFIETDTRRSAMIVPTRDRLYVINGADGFGQGIGTSEYFPCDLTGITGKAILSSVQPTLIRANAGVIVTGGTLSLLGGWGRDPSKPAGDDGTLASVDVALITGDTMGSFNLGPSLSMARNEHVALTVDNLVYALGGGSGNGTITTGSESATISAPQ